VGKVEDSIDNLVVSSNSNAQQKGRQCFADAGCNGVNYDQTALLDELLPCAYKSERDVQLNCKWRHTANVVIDLLLSVGRNAPNVASCMFDYFKEIGQRKLTDCVAKYPPTITPPFVAPAIPGFTDFNLDDVTQVVIYQLTTRYNLVKCKGCDGGSADELIECLVKNVNNNEASACDVRQECETQVGSGCKRRFDDVRQAVCNCAKSEFARGLDALGDWQDVKSMFAGGLERQLQICYVSTYPDGTCYASQWPAIHQKTRNVRTAVIKAFLEYQRTRQVPESTEDLLFVVTSVINELAGKWTGFYCGDCAQKESNSKIQADAFKAMLAKKAGQSCGEKENVPPPPPPPPARGTPALPSRPAVSADLSSAFDSFFGGK
jgi:hypothetical protein